MFLLLHLVMIFFFKCYGANETFTAGAFIINMGVTPQSINKGLKPYGMIYDLLKNYQVPIKWIINTGKIKDGADFTYNGVDYKGGPFIIPAEFRTTAVNTVINNWITAGVVGTTTTSSLTANVYQTMLFVPQWTMDRDNGTLVANFFVNAGIPATAHGGSVSTGWKLPSQLGNCDDVFALPHADPTWALHQNLYYWNQTFKGNIWAGCHAVSVLENITNPGATIQMNFLSTTGLVAYGSHANGSPPYSYQFPTEQVMQFMGTFDGSTTNGSEQIYMPKLAGAWRTGTKLLVYDPTQQDIPVKSPGPAAIAIYGRAYNDTARGYVMYEAGHDLDKGSIAERVAAQRAFFNFSFFSTHAKVAIPYIDISTVPDVVRRGDTVNFNYNLPPGYNAANYKTKWNNSCGGSFLPSDTLKITKFKVPTDPNVTTCVISVRITDACGRENFASKLIYVVSGILQSGWGNLTGKLIDNNVQLQWDTKYNDNLEKFVIERSSDGTSFTTIGYVAPAGTPSAKTLYNFTDNNISGKEYFYRIRAIDKQNKSVLSNIIFIAHKNKKISFKVVPNPVTDASTINFYSDKDRKIIVSCIDITGKKMANIYGFVKKGETRLDLKEMKQLAPGIYILKVQAESEMYYQKFIIGK